MKMFRAAEHRLVTVEPGPEPVGAAQVEAADTLGGLVAWGAGGNKPGWGLGVGVSHADLPPQVVYQTIPVNAAPNAVAAGFNGALPGTSSPYPSADSVAAKLGAAGF